MDSNVYKNQLSSVTEPYANDHWFLTWCFRHDNDPNHTRKFVKGCLQKNRIKVMHWPAQSPDNSPIQNLWKDVDTKTKQQKLTNKKGLLAAIRKAWNEISVERCERVDDSI